MITFIEGNAVELTVFNDELINEQYNSWINNREITAGLVSGSFPISMSENAAFVRANTTGMTSIFLAILVKDNKKHIGNIKLSNFDWISRTAELGILIGDSANQGKGYAKESCELLISHAWNELNLSKVWLTVFSGNTQAIGLYEKLGFIQEGRQKNQVYVQGQMMDKLFYGKFR